MGANLTLLSKDTLDLLTNKDVLRVNQTATHSAEVLHEGDLIAWRADLVGGDKAIALFNVGDTEGSIAKQLSVFGADLGGREWTVRSVYGGAAEVTGHEFIERIPAHGAVLLLLH